MAKITILNADTPEMAIEVSRDRFAIITTDDGRVYHIDFSDGNMWRANEDLSNLGKEHARLTRIMLDKEIGDSFIGNISA